MTQGHTSTTITTSKVPRTDRFELTQTLVKYHARTELNYGTASAKVPSNNRFQLQHSLLLNSQAWTDLNNHTASDKYQERIDLVYQTAFG
jgi:hypothetical protein